MACEQNQSKNYTSHDQVTKCSGVNGMPCSKCPRAEHILIMC